jgi:DNA-binding NarL/FixJ family response regulator
MADSIRIAIVDAHPLFRKGLVDTISGPRMTIVAQGETIEDMRRIVEQSKPDILIFDIGIPGGGVGVADNALRARSDLRIIILTASDDQADVADALRIGVHGYILKGVGGTELVDAIECVHLGQPYISPALATRLLVQTKGKSLLADRASVIGLTVRDKRVLHHLAKGLTNRQLASELGVDVRTIKYYLSRIFKKMRVQGRVEAILEAQKMRLDFRDQGHS